MSRIKQWLARWRAWKVRNEGRQKFDSHKHLDVITEGKFKVKVLCRACRLEIRQWNKHWCNVVRLTEIPKVN